LGNNDVASAKYIMKISSFVGTGLAIAVGLAIIIFRDVVGRLFSQDPDVWSLTAKICILVRNASHVVCVRVCVRA
jgi:Na+-driven multidrug efflux pump